MGYDDDGGLLGLLGAAALGIGAVIAGAVAVAGIIFLVKITYDAICNYLDKAKEIPGAEIAELIKEHMSEGKYKVVCNVFNNSGGKIDSQTWEGEKIDSDLEAEFGGENKIIYDLTA